MAQGEIFVQLSVNMADDPKMRALARFGRDARRARDLYVQMILYCRENLSDGRVPDDQLGILAYPDSPAVGRKDAERLAEVGLVERDGDGWHVPAFLKRNPSRAQVRADQAQKARGGLRGNHNRWHVRRAISDPDCPLCDSTPPPPPEPEPEPPDDPDPDRSPDRSSDPGSDIDRRSTESPETETETETETHESSTRRERGRAIARPTGPPPAKPRRPDGLTSIPDDFAITDAMRRWAIATFGEGLDLDFETQQFISYYRSTGDRRRSWPDQWQKWVRDSARRAAERARRPPPNGSPATPSRGTDHRLAEHADLIRRLAAEEGQP